MYKNYSSSQRKIDCAAELHNSHSFATGSYDNTIKIWNLQSNLNNNKSIKEEGNVLCLLEFEENMLLSGTNKNNINLWNLLNLELCYTFKGHKSWVNNLTKLIIYISEVVQMIIMYLFGITIIKCV